MGWSTTMSCCGEVSFLHLRRPEKAIRCPRNRNLCQANPRRCSADLKPNRWPLSPVICSFKELIDFLLAQEYMN